MVVICDLSNKYIAPLALHVCHPNMVSRVSMLLAQWIIGTYSNYTQAFLKDFPFPMFPGHENYCLISSHPYLLSCTVLRQGQWTLKYQNLPMLRGVYNNRSAGCSGKWPFIGCAYMYLFPKIIAALNTPTCFCSLLFV